MEKFNKKRFIVRFCKKGIIINQVIGEIPRKRDVKLRKSSILLSTNRNLFRVIVDLSTVLCWFDENTVYCWLNLDEVKKLKECAGVDFEVNNYIL